MADTEPTPQPESDLPREESYPARVIARLASLCVALGEVALELRRRPLPGPDEIEWDQGPCPELEEETRGRIVPAPESPIEHEDPLLTLDQLAALVNRSKFGLRKYYYRPPGHRLKMPEPDVEGVGGKAHMWYYSRIREWLERIFQIELDPAYPRRRRMG